MEKIRENLSKDPSIRGDPSSSFYFHVSEIRQGSKTLGGEGKKEIAPVRTELGFKYKGLKNLCKWQHPHVNQGGASQVRKYERGAASATQSKKKVAKKIGVSEKPARRRTKKRGPRAGGEKGQEEGHETLQSKVSFQGSDEKIRSEGKSKEGMEETGGKAWPTRPITF